MFCEQNSIIAHKAPHNVIFAPGYNGVRKLVSNVSGSGSGKLEQLCIKELFGEDLEEESGDREALHEGGEEKGEGRSQNKDGDVFEGVELEDEKEFSAAIGIEGELEELDKLGEELSQNE